MIIYPTTNNTNIRQSSFHCTTEEEINNTDAINGNINIGKTFGIQMY